jgi:LAO/AO transport system kinase
VRPDAGRAVLRTGVALRVRGIIADVGDAAQFGLELPIGMRASDGLRLDHVGIAVRSLAATKGFYELLGMKAGPEETVEFEQVRTVMLPMGESRIELLEALAEDSVIGRFVAKRGEGLHHIALRVDGVEAMFQRLKGDGVRLVSDSVRVGAGGHRYFFVHPASTGGVLVEIVGEGSE